uniref:Uncharacterized protein n=1 Tax=Anguilla anguilla TaxID=7936 RepID=A0A0E9XJ18_ANGAN
MLTYFQVLGLQTVALHCFHKYPAVYMDCGKKCKFI